MRLLKKMISAFLVVCMVISMVPMAALATETDSAQSVDGRIMMDSSIDQASVWIDGIEYAVQNSGGSKYVDLPAGTEPKSMVTYSYHVGDADDVHTQYPVGMQVWALNKNADGSYTPEKVEELNNILQYSGSSIRITGNKGIRMITSIEQNKKNDLTSGGLGGYKLLEYGTVLAWSSDLAGGNPLVLGPDYAKSNYAYKKDVADPVFAYSGNLMQYTNVLVGFTLDECKDDIAMRPYMILEGPDGEQMTIYGGIVHRSIGYIAWQNKDVFTPNSAAYNYVWEIINHVYAEVTFETNGGSALESALVQKGNILEKPAEPEKEGSTFAGWYKDEDLTEVFDFASAIDGDLTLYAKWLKDGGSDFDSVSLRLSETEFIVGDNATVYFYADVTGDLNSIMLVDSSTGNNVMELIDDGLYSSSGDDLSGDGVFSGKMTLDTTAEMLYSYHVSADDTYISNSVTISVLSTFSEEQLDKMEEVDQTLADDVFGAPGYDDMSLDERKDLVEDVLEDLSDGGLIDISTVYYDEDSAIYSFMYESGALGAIIVDDTYLTNTEHPINSVNIELSDEEIVDEEAIDEEVTDEEATDEEATDEEVTDEEATDEEATDEEATDEEATDEEATNEEAADEEATNEEAADEKSAEEIERVEVDTNYSSSSYALNTTNLDEPTVSIGDAIVLWSFGQKWDDSSFRVPFYENLEDHWEEKGLNTVVDWTTTVEDYKNLKGYEVIVFSGHGAYMTYTYKESLFAEKQTLTVPSLLLTEKSTSKQDKAYTSDLKNFRIGKISVQGGTKYAILPAFFTAYYDSDDLNGSFIFAENCEFRGKDGNINSAMPDALLAASAEAVIGFHNSVMAEYSRNLMYTYVNCLIAGLDAGSAFDTAKNINGENDYFDGRLKYGPTAYPLFSGDTTAKLVQSGIKNGSFELATTPAYWNQVGDTRIVKQLGELNPQDGSSMAIITTGIGSAEDDYMSGTEGSILSQSFIVPSSQTTLTLSYDVVSEEPMEYVGSSYNDTFVARILHEDGTSELLREDINTSIWHGIEGINFDGGDFTMYHTLWKTVSFDLSAYAGETITIQFVVYDMGDSIYDTAVLIDNVAMH